MRYYNVIMSDFGEAFASDDFVRAYGGIHYLTHNKIPPKREKALVELVNHLYMLQRHFGGKGQIDLDKVLAAICEKEQEYPVP